MRGSLLAGALVLLAVLVMPILFGFADLQGEVSQAGYPTHPDIPAVAMRAYVVGARMSNDQHPACRLSWALLAGIGKKESDHGRWGGRSLGSDGRTAPPIIGIALDGGPGVAAVPDTDGGRLDGDTVWDRAVGPMQFIPGTWLTEGVDGDGDGGVDPQDIDDAAASAGGLLCGDGTRDLGGLAGMATAVLSYNQSSSYVAEVLELMQAYLVEADALLLVGAGPIACPVAPPVSFIDSWGFARSGGRTHKGQDMFAPTGTDLVAVDDAVVTVIGSSGGLGGRRIWLRTTDGHAWYYAHLDAFAPGLVAGDVVQRGQVIGTVGQTGNAATTPPHLHIQWRPAGRGGPDVNSYALLDAACPGHNGQQLS